MSRFNHHPKPSDQHSSILRTSFRSFSNCSLLNPSSSTLNAKLRPLLSHSTSNFVRPPHNSVNMLTSRSFSSTNYYDARTSRTRRSESDILQRHSPSSRLLAMRPATDLSANFPIYINGHLNDKHHQYKMMTHPSVRERKTMTTTTKISNQQQQPRRQTHAPDTNGLCINVLHDDFKNLTPLMPTLPKLLTEKSFSLRNKKYEIIFELIFVVVVVVGLFKHI